MAGSIGRVARLSASIAVASCADVSDESKPKLRWQRRFYIWLNRWRIRILVSSPSPLPSSIEIDIEISVLTPEREVRSITEIEIGRHGLIVEQGRRRGLLLPQVATEQGWDRETFVEHTCRKATLASDAWLHGARLFVFEAQVFGEVTQV